MDAKKKHHCKYHCTRLCETFDNRLLSALTEETGATNDNALSLIITIVIKIIKILLLLLIIIIVLIIINNNINFLIFFKKEYTIPFSICLYY